MREPWRFLSRSLDATAFAASKHNSLPRQLVPRRSDKYRPVKVFLFFARFAGTPSN
jgi:hypothetical protein